MKKMGIQQEDILAKQVIIQLEDKEIVITEPSIQKVNMMGQYSYQISGQESIRSIDSMPEITDEDIKTVMEQVNCSEEKAKKAIVDSKGDLAEAILSLTQ